MYHHHFHSINSTQIYLKDNLDALKKSEENILISCSHQTDGIGRRGNVWDNYDNSIAMSFTYKPNAIASLTPLEIGVITVRFFKKVFNKELKLKWPNDLMTNDGKKCGGILCQYIDQNTVLVGIGINLGKHERIINHEYRYAVGSIDQGLILSEIDQEKIANELYAYLLEERLRDPKEIRNEFNSHCIHMNKEVFLFEDGIDRVGFFRGIGENGEATIEINGEVKSFLSGSLTILN
jgi:BirA family biotin operon repressor/biotin-[acetyl-CoA-carboxylase] ligase